MLFYLFTYLLMGALGANSATPALRDFTPDQLLKYNGVENELKYVARYDIVYDVSSLDFPSDVLGKEIDNDTVSLF